MFYNSGVHNLQDLMPDDLGWSRCNNKKNEVYKKVTCLNHPETIPTSPPLSAEKLSS